MAARLGGIHVYYDLAIGKVIYSLTQLEGATGINIEKATTLTSTNGNGTNWRVAAESENVWMRGC